MSYDKYRSWPLPYKSGNVFPVFQGAQIEEQVIKDLEQTKDPTEKLEILDSFAAYAQRDYRVRQSELLSSQIAQALGIILEPTIGKWLLEVKPVARARVAKPVER